MLVRSALINIMTRAAQQAGHALIRDFGEVERLQASRKGPGDFVSSADHKAAAKIRESLSRARPSWGLLMEESGVVAGADPTKRFIVDPLDGTLNFLHGLPHFAVSIAAEEEGVLTAGVIFDPVKDELFWAEKGEGAWMNSQRLRVSARTRAAESVIATGISAIGRTADEAHRRFQRQMGAVMVETAGLRRWGAAALDLAYVAAGRYEGFWEEGLQPWDVAAGVVLVREAGGFVSDSAGRAFDLDRATDLVAANAGLHRPLLSWLSAARSVL